MGCVQTVGPNEALVVSGGFSGSTKKQAIVGGWVCNPCGCLTDIERISLEVMTLFPKCEDVETAEGVALNVSGVAQCKIIRTDELLMVACEQFASKSVNEVKESISQTLDGHLRSILGTLTVEQINKDREQFAALVREVAGNFYSQSDFLGEPQLLL